jgi:hypothetical protein
VAVPPCAAGRCRAGPLNPLAPYMPGERTPGSYQVPHAPAAVPAPCPAGCSCAAGRVAAAGAAVGPHPWHCAGCCWHCRHCCWAGVAAGGAAHCPGGWCWAGAASPGSPSAWLPVCSTHTRQAHSVMHPRSHAVVCQAAHMPQCKQIRATMPRCALTCQTPRSTPPYAPCSLASSVAMTDSWTHIGAP